MKPRFVACCAWLAVAGLLTAGCRSTETKARPAPTSPVGAGVGSTVNRHGPFALGTRTETFIDTSRKTPANGSVPEQPSRTLETLITYPAQGTPDPDHPITGAAPAPGRFPVALFVHGFSAHASNPYLQYWAAAGFVAVAVKFPLTNADAPGGPTLTDTVNEPADVRFVLDQIAHLPVQDADLQPIIDASRVGVMGQSSGATVAFDLGYNDRYQDPRIKAVVAVSGGCVGCPPGIEDPDGKFFTGPSVPVMFIHGTADPVAPIEHSAQEYAKAPAPKFLVSLVGAEHVQFGPPWEPIAARATIDFFERYLEDEGGALRRLQADANVAGVAGLQQAPS
jgi:predicted dienelactone hydrolase